jgi:hypothetical protein
MTLDRYASLFAATSGRAGLTTLPDMFVLMFDLSANVYSERAKSMMLAICRHVS